VNGSLLSFCEWLENTPLGAGIRESVWWFTVLEITHTLSIILVAGTILLVDLRLLGYGLKREPVSDVVSYVVPWTLSGFMLMAITGVLLVVSEAVQIYNSTPFRIKMLLLGLAGLNALIFHYTIYRDAANWDDAPVAPFRARLAGFLSLLLWIGIIASGRAIAYSPEYKG
jgi:hypothetical protein